MIRIVNAQKNLLLIGVPLLLIGIMIILANSSIFEQYPENLSTGITIDLILIIPLIYFAIIRKTTIPKITVILFLILGVLVCSAIIPAQNQYYLDLFKTWVFPIIELVVVSYVIYNINKAIKHHKLQKNETLDFFTALKNTCCEILPKVAAHAMATEIAVFYYGFIHWRKKKLNESEFSYHKDSGTVTLLIVIIFIIGIETFALHLLIAKWNGTVAWILTFFSIYSGIQIFGFLKSMYKRPITIENDKLLLRYGIMNDTVIHLGNIEKIELSIKEIETNKEIRKLSFFGQLESHNVVISLKEENTLKGLYGTQRKYKTLALHVDEKVEFVNRIESALRH